MSGSHITIPATSPIITYAGNGTQTAFPVPFPYFTPADVQVFVGGVLQATGYSLSGTAADAGFSSGTVTFSTAPANGAAIVIRRVVVPQRTTDFGYPSQTFDIRALNTELDRLVAMLQERDALDSSALRGPPGETIAEIPSAAARAGKLLGFDLASNPIAVAGTVGGAIVSPFAATLLDDADADAVLATLGATAIGRALLRAANEAAARAMLGVEAPYADLASAATTNIGATSGQAVRITGTTTITSFGTAASGVRRVLRFAASLTLTHNASSLILPGGANIVTAAGDTADAVSLGGGNWLVTSYTPATTAGMRSLAGAAPLPQAGAGVGRVEAINPTPGSALVAPAGGTWRVTWQGINISTGGFSAGFNTGVFAGGATVAAATVGVAWTAEAWRIA